MFENIELLKWLSPAELSTLELFCQERLYKKWETLFLKWDEATSMYIVKTWILEVEDDWKLLGNIVSWEIVWEMALFWDNKKRTATVRSASDTMVIVILGFSITDLSNKYPNILDKIKSIINIRNKKNKFIK